MDLNQFFYTCEKIECHTFVHILNHSLKYAAFRFKEQALHFNSTVCYMLGMHLAIRSDY